MRRYNPYALVSDMRGELGAAGFVAPAVLPDPRKSEASAREYLKIWLSWAEAREQMLREWAGVISSMIADQTASCQSIKEYDDAAITHYFAEVDMFDRLIRFGGLSEEDLPPPFFPVIFASSTRVRDLSAKVFGRLVPTGKIAIQYALPCPPIDPFGPNPRFTFPADYAKLRAFGDPSNDSFTAPSQLGQVPPQLIIPTVSWAAVALTALIVGGVALSILLVFRGINNTRLAELNKEIKGLNTDLKFARAAENSKCVKDSFAEIKATGAALSADDIIRIRSGCAAGAATIFPLEEEIKEPRSLGTGLLVGGLGIAAVVLSVAFLKRQKHES